MELGVVEPRSKCYSIKCRMSNNPQLKSAAGRRHEQPGFSYLFITANKTRVVNCQGMRGRFFTTNSHKQGHRGTALYPPS